MMQMTHVARTLLFFLVAAAILAGACLVKADVATAVASDAAKTTPLTREHLLAELSREISSHFNLEGELQLDLLRAWNSPARVASHWDIHILEYPSVPTSSMMLRVRFAADGEPVGDTNLMLRASLWRDVWVARQPLTVGAVFEPGMLDARRTDLFRERDVLPAAVGDNTYIFARAIAAGRTLTWRDIARRPLVKKGELVEVSAADGMLLVTMKAIARENGARGDTVTVRNPESRRDFAAMVIGENRVQVRF